MIVIDNVKKRISITRGDTGRFQVSAKYDNGDEYVPVEGDKLKFAVASAWGKVPLFEIENVMVTDAEEFWTVVIEPEHTKNLKFIEYVYDIQLTIGSGIYTIVGKTGDCTPTFEVWGEVSE